MKILYYFEEKNTLMDKWQEAHIFSELKLHGVEIEVFNPLKYTTIDIANENLLKRVTKKDFDLFMTPHNESKLYKKSLDRIKYLSIPTLLICFDNLVIPFEHKNICQYFDLVWLTSSETDALFKKWGANTIFLPYAANPHLFKPAKDEEIDKLCFVGTPYGSRVNTLNALISQNVDVDLYSNVKANSKTSNSPLSLSAYIKPFVNLIRFSYGRKIILGALKQKIIRGALLEKNSNHIRFLEPVPLRELGGVYSKYALSLSSTAARNTGVLNKPLNIINLRSFEIPMAGGLQICPYTEELAGYFSEDKEIVFYRSDIELIEKSKFYLSEDNRELRNSMKKAARLRAEKEHSWFARFKLVFDHFDLEYSEESE